MQDLYSTQHFIILPIQYDYLSSKGIELTIMNMMSIVQGVLVSKVKELKGRMTACCVSRRQTASGSGASSRESLHHIHLGRGGTVCRAGSIEEGWRQKQRQRSLLWFLISCRASYCALRVF